MLAQTYLIKLLMHEDSKSVCFSIFKLTCMFHVAIYSFMYDYIMLLFIVSFVMTKKKSYSRHYNDVLK